MRYKKITIIRIILTLLVFTIFLPEHVRSAGDEPGTLKWTFQINSPTTPAIGEDGTIYVTSLRFRENALYAINTDGTEKWRFQTDKLAYDPALGEGGIIYMGCRDRHLYAVNPNGILKWKFAGRGPMHEPAVGEDGTVYVGDGTGELYAVNPDGTEKWRLETGLRIIPTRGKPVIGNDGAIYLKDFKSILAVNPDGTERWRFETDERLVSGPVLGTDGMLYVGVGEMENYLYLINPDDGSIHRIFPVNITTLTEPVIDSDGIVYVGLFGMEYEEHKRLFAINPDGTEKWCFTTAGALSASPAIGDNGTIYVGCQHGILYAVNPDGTEKWRLEVGGAIVGASPVIGHDGTIYVADDKYLYAVRGDSGGLATDAPWPKYQRDYRNSGRYQESRPNQ